MAFLGLEKIFGKYRILHKLIWQAYSVPEVYVQWVQLFYRNVSSVIQTQQGPLAPSTLGSIMDQPFYHCTPSTACTQEQATASCPIKSSNILDGVPEIWAAPSSQVSSMSTRPKSKIYKISTELSAGQQQGSWLSTRWKYTALHHLQIRCTNERHPEEGANRSKPCRRMCSGPCVYLGSAVARFSCQWEKLGHPFKQDQLEMNAIKNVLPFPQKIRYPYKANNTRLAFWNLLGSLQLSLRCDGVISSTTWLNISISLHRGGHNHTSCPL